MRLPDRTPIRKKIIELVPPRAMIGTDVRSGSLLIASGLTVGGINYYPYCDFYFYDLSESHIGTSCDFHQKLLKNPEFGLVWYSSVSGGNYYLFQRGVVSKYPNPLRRLSEDEWNASGPELKLPDNNHLFAVKVQPKETAGKLHIKLTIGSRTVLDKFYQVTVYASDGQNTQYFKFLFANGFVTPADIKPGDVFQVELPLPSSWTRLHSFGCKIESK